MAKVTKVKGGIKSQGMRNAKWDKLGKQENGSDKKAPHDQLSGGSAKKLKEKKD